MGVRARGEVDADGEDLSSIDREVDERCCYPTRSALNRDSRDRLRDVSRHTASRQHAVALRDSKQNDDVKSMQL
jgi:hypothetical protein